MTADVELNENRKILFVSQYFPPDITAAAFRIHETASWMSTFGMDVTVLTAYPHRGEDDLEEKRKAFDRKQPYRIIRCPIWCGQGEGMGTYLCHYGSFMMSSLFCGIVQAPNRFDGVVATSPPLFVGMTGYLLSRLKATSFYLDIRDLWPDSAVAAGKLQSSGTAYRIAKDLERRLYDNADAVTCVSSRMKEQIEKTKKADPPVSVVYNAVDREEITEWEENINPLNPHHDPDLEDLSISYLGNMGLVQGLDVVVEAARQCQDLPVQFYLIGGGAEKERLQQKVDQQSLDNVHLMGPFDKKKALAYMLGSSALLVHLEDSEVLKNTIPSKVFDYLFANRPILYGIDGEGRDLLDELDGNLYFEPENAGHLTDTVREMTKNYEHYRSKAQNNRPFLLERFDREKMSRRWISSLHTS